MVKRDTEWVSRILNPRLTVLVTCVDKKGKPNIISVSLAMPISYNPPIIGICVRPTRYSYKLLKQTREFILNIPSINLAKHVTLCGTVSGEKVNKFKKTGLKAVEAKIVKAPIIDECIGHVECEVIREIHVGDHSLFLGKVVAAYVDENCFNEEWLPNKARLVLLLGGKKTPLYATITKTFTASQ